MKSDIQEVSSTRSVLAFTFTEEDYAKARAGELKNAVAAVTIPGFRKGKAPAALVDQKFGDRVTAETKQTLVRKAYEQIVSDKALKVVELVNLGTFEKKADGSYGVEITIDLEPVFDLPETDGLPIDDTKTEVTDEQVANQMALIRKSFATFEDLREGETFVDDDMATVDYVGTIDGKPLVETVADAGTFSEKKGAWCTIGSEYFMVPGLPKALVGAGLGSTGVLAVEFPKDFYKESLRGLKVDYAWTVTGGRRQIVPEWNAEMFKKFDVSSTEEVEKRVRDVLTARAAEDDENRHIDQVVNALASRVSFDVPESLLVRATEDTLDRMLQNNMDRGVSKEDLSKERDRLSASAKEQATRQLRLEFLFSALIRARGLTLEPAELQEAIRSYVAQHCRTDSERKSFLDDRTAVRNFSRMVLRRKLLKAILEKAKPTADLATK